MAENSTVLRKHSIRISGHHTSVSLEDPFWTALKRIAAERGTSLNQIISEIDETRPGNLSGAIRVYVLKTLEEKIAD
jgi:predicted DNA-binding ribbon-helix-helix protein